MRVFPSKQLKDPCKNQVDEFSIGLADENNILEWSITIIGPPDTLYIALEESSNNKEQRSTDTDNNPIINGDQEGRLIVVIIIENLSFFSTKMATSSGPLPTFWKTHPSRCHPHILATKKSIKSMFASPRVRFQLSVSTKGRVPDSVSFSRSVVITVVAWVKRQYGRVF
ncbi:hypothetical protein TB2_022674 [Malus domestica]